MLPVCCHHLHTHGKRDMVSVFSITLLLSCLLRHLKLNYGPRKVSESCREAGL